MAYGHIQLFRAAVSFGRYIGHLAEQVLAVDIGVIVYELLGQVLVVIQDFG